MIINDRIPMLKKGYPTVSDKYNVSGAILDGSAAVKFGELVKFGSTKGYFEAASEGLTAVTDAAGFVVATNVKLAEGFPGDTVQVNPGEAFNLLVNGFIAVELDEDATKAQVKPNASVCVILATGALTTVDNVSSDTVVALPNVVFTGIVEEHGDTLYAEIYVK